MISGNNSETRPAVAADELAGQILLLDALHSAAAEGRLQQLCPLPEDALKSWLAEIQYLAGETLRRNRAPCRAPHCATAAPAAQRPGQTQPHCDIVRSGAGDMEARGERDDRRAGAPAQRQQLGAAGRGQRAARHQPPAGRQGHHRRGEWPLPAHRQPPLRRALRHCPAHLRQRAAPPRHWSRKGVLLRDNFTCIYCGARPGSRQKGRVLARNDLTIDHILPRSRGGRDHWTNTACACTACNHRKGDRLPHEAGMRSAQRAPHPAHQLPRHRRRQRPGCLEAVYRVLRAGTPPVSVAIPAAFFIAHDSSSLSK